MHGRNLAMRVFSVSVIWSGALGAWRCATTVLHFPEIICQSNSVAVQWLGITSLSGDSCFPSVCLQGNQGSLCPDSLTKLSLKKYILQKSTWWNFCCRGRIKVMLVDDCFQWKCLSSLPITAAAAAAARKSTATASQRRKKNITLTERQSSGSCIDFLEMKFYVLVMNSENSLPSHYIFWRAGKSHPYSTWKPALSRVAKHRAPWLSVCVSSVSDETGRLHF